MDKPLPDGFDPYSAGHPAHGKHNRRNCREQGGDHYGDADTTDCGPEGPCSDYAPELPQSSHETSMYQRLLDFGLSLLTPPRNAGPQEMRRHAIALSVAVALIYAHIAIACGWLSSIGLSGFASASNLSKVEDQVANINVTLTGIAIRDLYRSMCNSASYDDRSVLNGMLQQELAKYKRLAGEPYKLPECPMRD